MLTAIIFFTLGVVLAPIIKPLLRPLLVELIKVVLTTAEELRRLSAKVKEDIEDAAAEAQSQRASTTPPDTSAPQPPPAGEKTGS